MFQLNTLFTGFLTLSVIGTVIIRCIATPSKLLAKVQESPESLLYNDLDDYIPFGNDVHDPFSWKLFRTVLAEESTNVIISPFSVKLLLAALAEGAGNNTQTQRELIGTLESIKLPDNLRGYYKKVLSSLKKESIYHTLSLETRLFVSALIEPKQRFTGMLAAYYGTNVEALDFSDAQGSADKINAWCANVTNNRLTQLITKESVKNSVLLLTNVLYFNGVWRRQFTETFEEVFLKSPTQLVQVEYMELTDYFYFYRAPTPTDSDKVQLLRLPYRGKRFSMFILYSANINVEKLAEKLENDQIKQMQFMMEETKLRVVLPKFEFDFDKKLKDTLSSLGVNEIFTDKASLPGLDRGANVAGKLKVTDVLQKAGISVNEKGTEAYASTVIEIGNKFGGNPIVEEFIVNRPFIFFIEEEATGSIIFAGKVVQP